MKFKDLKPYDSFRLNGQLCFKLDERRYISPSGTHSVGSILMEVMV